MAQIDIQSAEIAHALSLIRASVGIANSVKKRLDSIENQIIGLLSKHDSVSSIRLRNQLIAELNAIVLENMDKVGDSIVKQVNAIAGEEIKYQRAVLLNGTTATRIVKPATEALIKRFEKNPMVMQSGGKFEVQTVAQRVNRFKEGYAETISNLIYAGWQEGATTQQLKKQILGETGVTSYTRNVERAAYGLAKDLTSHMSSQTKMSFAELNKDIVDGITYIATLDTHTSDFCKGRDNVTILFSENKNPPLSPFHRFCRTTWIYHIKPEYQLDIDDTRPSVVDGEAKQVSGDKDYYDVVKTWPKEARELALGKTKAYLFDEMGKEDFIKAAYDQMNTPLTIEEMVATNKTVARLLKRE